MLQNDERWAAYWFFNTNETNGPGAYRSMFARNVAAIWGYPDGPRKLEGARPGDRVLAYVNAQGLRALGVVVDGAVVAGTGIFLKPTGEQQPNEFHLKVRWEVIVLPKEAISSFEAQLDKYKLPVRCTFARFSDQDKAREFAQVLHSRSGS